MPGKAGSAPGPCAKVLTSPPQRAHTGPCVMLPRAVASLQGSGSRGVAECRRRGQSVMPAPHPAPVRELRDLSSVGLARPPGWERGVPVLVAVVTQVSAHRERPRVDRSLQGMCVLGPWVTRSQVLLGQWSIEAVLEEESWNGLGKQLGQRQGGPKVQGLLGYREAASVARV